MGQRADGTPIAVMPFESFKVMDDAELDALFTFLKALPPEGFWQPLTSAAMLNRRRLS